jgi:hypothetical protein
MSDTAAAAFAAGSAQRIASYGVFQHYKLKSTQLQE